jgi:hypothetical protein
MAASLSFTDACWHNRADEVEAALAAAGAGSARDLLLSGGGGHSALRVAALRGHAGLVRRLICAYVDSTSGGLAAALGAQSHVALLLASHGGAADVVRELLAGYAATGTAAAGLAARDYGALRLSVSAGHGAVASLLLGACPAPLLAELSWTVTPGGPLAQALVGCAAAWVQRPAAVAAAATARSRTAAARRAASARRERTDGRASIDNGGGGSAADAEDAGADANAARRLLTRPQREAAAAAVLLAVSRTPPGVRAPLMDHLRARPWLLFTVQLPPSTAGGEA